MKRKITWITSSLLLAALACGWFLAPHAQPVKAAGRAKINCTNGTLDGSYGYRMEGTALGIGPSVLVGILTHNYKGTFTGHITASYNGQIVPFIPINGTFKVNNDCTFTQAFELKLDPAAPAVRVTGKAVIVNEGREFFLMNTDQGNLLSGTAKRID